MTLEGDVVVLFESSAFSVSQDWIVSKIDSNGVFLWSRAIGAPNRDIPGGLDIRDDGVIVVSGTAVGLGSSGPIVLLSPDGNLIDMRQITGPSFVGIDDVAVSSYGDIAFSGITTGYGSGVDSFYVALLNSTLDFQWGKAWNSTRRGCSTKVAFTPSGNILVGGTIESIARGDQIVFTEYELLTGDAQWTTFFGGANNDGLGSFSFAPDGGILIGGFTRGFQISLSSDDALIVELTHNGEIANCAYADPFLPSFLDIPPSALTLVIYDVTNITVTPGNWTMQRVALSLTMRGTVCFDQPIDQNSSSNPMTSSRDLSVASFRVASPRSRPLRTSLTPTPNVIARTSPPTFNSPDISTSASISSTAPASIPISVLTSAPTSAPTSIPSTTQMLLQSLSDTMNTLMGSLTPFSTSVPSLPDPLSSARVFDGNFNFNSDLDIIFIDGIADITTDNINFNLPPGVADNIFISFNLDGYRLLVDGAEVPIDLFTYAMLQDSSDIQLIVDSTCVDTNTIEVEATSDNGFSEIFSINAQQTSCSYGNSASLLSYGAARLLTTVGLGFFAERISSSSPSPDSSGFVPGN